MPQLVQIDGIGTVEFDDDFTPDEIKGQVSKLYRSTTYEGQLEDLGLTEADVTEATRRSDKQADLLARQRAAAKPTAGEKVYGALGAVGDGINWGFKKLNWAISSIPAVVADASEGWLPEDKAAEEAIQDPEQMPGGFRNLKAWWKGATASKQPAYQDVAGSTDVQQDFWANVGAKVSLAGSDLLPRLYLMRGLGAAKLSTTAGAGAVAFGAGEEGFSGRSAALGAIIPGVQQVGKLATGAVLAKLGGKALPGGGQKALEEMGGLAAIQAFNTAAHSPELVKLYQEDEQQFWHQLAADTVVNLGFLALSAPTWKPGVPSYTERSTLEPFKPGALIRSLQVQPPDKTAPPYRPGPRAPEREAQKAAAIAEREAERLRPRQPAVPPPVPVEPTAPAAPPYVGPGPVAAPAGGQAVPGVPQRDVLGEAGARWSRRACATRRTWKPTSATRRGVRPCPSRNHQSPSRFHRRRRTCPWC